MEGLGTLIIIGVGIALVCVLIWAYLHHRYVKSLEAKGWSYDGSPGISTAYGLNVAPFGVGFERKVRHHGDRPLPARLLRPRAGLRLEGSRRLAPADPQLEWQPTSAQPGGDERTG